MPGPRILVIGNSGAGKSHLAAALAARAHARPAAPGHDEPALQAKELQAAEAQGWLAAQSAEWLTAKAHEKLAAPTASRSPCRPLPVIGLDALHWFPGGAPRPPEEARTATREAADGPAWVIEGVFGWLAAEALPRATLLLWLDLPWSVCEAGLHQRGPDPARPAAAFEALLAWAGDYATRQSSSSSLAGHKALFDGFAGPKYRFTSRAEASLFVVSGPWPG